MATANDMRRELKEIFHELTPKERLSAMRSTMGKISREIRRQATTDLGALSYEARPPKGKKTKNRAKALKKTVVAVAYRRAIGFHVTVASRKARAGGHTRVDHQNRWGQWKPAARWLNDGTVRQEARPFMEGAERKLNSYESHIKEVFEAKVEEVARKHNG